MQLPWWAKPLPEPAGGGSWAIVREAQLMTLKVPKTAMVVAIDAGSDSIHPIDKEPVGERLARAALGLVYGEKGEFAGPIFREQKIEGGTIRLFFDHIGLGLRTPGGVPLEQFAIAGDDKKFVWATAVIDGNEVVVSSPEVPHPAFVRYAWQTNPQGCNLYNRDGFPASPFRTDEVKTERGGSYKKMMEQPPTFRSRL